MKAFLPLVIVVGLFFLVGACGGETTNEGDSSGITGRLPEVDPQSVADLPGDELARIYCGSCHLFPDPSLLDKNTWGNQVLPAMGFRLGIRDERANPFQNLSLEETKIVLAGKVFPTAPVLPEESWRRIVDFYEREAPDTLADAATDGSVLLLAGFRLTPVDLQIDGPALTTMVNWQSRDALLYLGDGWGGVHAVSADGQRRGAWKVEKAVVDFHAGDAGDFYLLSIGSIVPREVPIGALIHVDAQGRQNFLLRDLPRPVAMSFGDLNGDSREDIVISCFGYYTGRLSWYEREAGGQLTEHVLLNTPGALQNYILDLDQDGRPDILVLMAQGNEGVFAFFNEGGGRFRQENLLRFPPVYGSAWLEPLDFDGDGDLDLLYVNGDNADYSAVAKPYHGIRLFLNDGNNQFAEAFFYPFDGAYKAQCLDFDGDGDRDIAAISFFPEFAREVPISFVLLENQGSLQFSAHTLPEANNGRWLTMTAGDLNGDERPDIVFGAFNVPSDRRTPTQWEALQQDSVDVLLLWNEGK